MQDKRNRKENGEWLSMWGAIANNLGKKGMIVFTSLKRSANHSFAFHLYTFADGSFTSLGDNHYGKSYKFTVRCVKSE